jgi:hypothetical protein
VGWIGYSTRTAQLNNSSVGLGHRHDQLKTTSKDRSSRNGTSIQVSTTLFRRRREPPQTARNKNLSSPPLKGESTAYYFFFLSFLSHSTTEKEKEEKQTTEEHVLTKRPPPKHHGRAEVSDRDAQCRLQEGYDARRANDTVP